MKQDVHEIGLEAAMQATHDAEHGWNLDFLPLEPGPVVSDISFVASRCVHAMHAQIHSRTDQRGTAPKQGITFSLSDEKASPFVWDGTEITPNSIMSFAPGGSIDAIGQPDFGVFAFTIPIELLEEAAGAPCDELGAQLDSQQNCKILRNGSHVDEIRCLMERLMRNQRPSESEMERILMGDLPRVIASLMRSRSVEASHSLRASRVGAVARTVRYVRENAEDVPTVEELCDVSGLKQRTLYNAFVEHVGLSPKAYLQALRLESVRSDLGSSEPEKAVIADVANRWGFWHLGQFAADYRNRFGELPSETLSRGTRAPTNLRPLA